MFLQFCSIGYRRVQFVWRTFHYARSNPYIPSPECWTPLGGEAYILLSTDRLCRCITTLSLSLYIYIYIYISPMEQQRDGKRVYRGISAGHWKQRWYSHRHSFSNPKLRYQTALSKYYWGLKDQGLFPQIKWKILRHSSAANSFNGRCNLCLDKKISIINFKNRKLLLNKRNELVFKCRRRGRFKLS